MYFYKFIISLVLILVSYWPKCSTLTNHPDYDDSPVVREKYALFHCFKLRTCTPGGDKVCGYDSTEQFLAEFEDMCTFHKVNCQKRGFFQLVDEPICEGQKKFLSQTRDYDMFDRNLTSRLNNVLRYT